MKRITGTILITLLVALGCSATQQYLREQEERDMLYGEGGRPSLSKHQYDNYYMYYLNKDRPYWPITSDQGKQTLRRTYGNRTLTLREWHRGARPPYWTRIYEYRSKESYCRKYYGRYPCSIER